MTHTFIIPAYSQETFFQALENLCNQHELFFPILEHRIDGDKLYVKLEFVDLDELVILGIEYGRCMMNEEMINRQLAKKLFS